MPTGKYSSADVATPENSEQASAPDDNRNAIQRSFDENTQTDYKEPLVKTGLKATAGAIGGPFIHPIESAKSMISPNVSLDEMQAANDTSDPRFTHELAKTGGNLLGTAALGGAIKAAPGAIEGIPTRAKAGAVFNDLNTKLANQPVNLGESGPQLEQLEKIGSTGPGAPSTVNKLIDRSRAMYPMNYPEARLFQENLASPSITEKEGMGGSMKGGVKQLNKAFYNDIHGAAEAGGLGEDYAKAMKDYKTAAQLNHAFKTAGKAAAMGAAGAGTYRLAKDLIP